MIEASHLTKRFAGAEVVTAVDQLSFRAEPGQVFGLLGTNGAGKTTTLRMLSTLLSPDEGTAVLNGHDIRTDPVGVRRSIGFLSTTTNLYDRLTSLETLVHFGHLQGVAHPTKRAEELVERFGIEEFRHQRVGNLSTGMKQKVNIARTLVHDPPILILDEPTNGLDVLVAADFLTFVGDARAEGKCVLLSTHIMREAERLCDRIAIVHAGQIRAEGTLPELQEQTGREYLEDVFVAAVGEQ